MNDRFHAPGQPQAARVNHLFTAIAQRYDRINDLQSFGLHRCWKRRVVELAQVQPGDHALDLCCGTGDIAFALAAKGADVAGLDFNEAMLAVAEARRPRSVAAAQKVNPQFLCGDAQRVPFPDASFDIVTVGYGLRNLTSWEAGLQEMNRVARPGGRLVVLDFGKPENILWRAVYFAYLKRVVPTLGRIFCRNADAYAYILESLRSYPAQAGVASKMRELGLTGVQTINLLGGAMGLNCGTKAGGRGMKVSH